MNEENPYASPQYAGDPVFDRGFAPATVVEQAQHDRGLFRKGNQLVMNKHATLPDRCVKSNAPTSRRLRRSMSWHSPIIYLLILAGILIYIIVALFVTKKATIYIGLSDEWFRKRRYALLIAWFTALLGIAAFIGSVLIVCDPHSHVDWAGWGMLVGVSLLIGGAIYGILAARMVVPVRITDDFVWLKGVHPDFLADLPEWPYRP